MRTSHPKKWYVMWFLVAFAMLGIGWWNHNVGTGNSVSASTFRKLHTLMTRTEVEALLGPPTSQVADVCTQVENHHDAPIINVPPANAPRQGDLTSDGSMQLIPHSLEAIVAGFDWEGGEGRIRVFYDEQDRVMWAWFYQRVSWQFKLRQSLPWMR